MNDIADARSIAVVRTRLPYIDRRALSQAWFSALHVADAAPAARVRAVVKSATPAAHGSHVPAPSGRRPVRAAAAQAAPSPRATATRRRDASADVPTQRSQRARAQRAADASANAATRSTALDDVRSYPPFQTSLTVGAEGARVALLLRREGPTLHVVALCAPANVELVRRALACADTYLRLRGDTVRASVRSTGDVRA